MRNPVLINGAALVLVVATSCDQSVTGKAYAPIRYKLTATVDTPQGPKTGSAVNEVELRMPGSFLGTQGSAGFSAKAEAVAVDIRPGETLFILIASPKDRDLPANILNAIPIPKRGEASASEASGRIAETDSAIGFLRSDRGAHPVWTPSERPEGKVNPYMPYFVRFRNIKDPASVELVDPDDLGKSFGSGVKLKSFTIEITDEPLTKQIEQRLPWLADLGRIRGTLIPNPPRLQKDGGPLTDIGPTEFTTELYK